MCADESSFRNRLGQIGTTIKAGTERFVKWAGENKQGIEATVGIGSALRSLFRPLADKFAARRDRARQEEKTVAMNTEGQKIPETRQPRLEVTIQILGAQGVGKTTLWNRLRGESPWIWKTEPTEGAVPLRSFIYRDPNGDFPPVRFTEPYDVGGDRQYQEKDWEDVWAQTQPDAVIVVIDHSDPDRHREALSAIGRFFEGKTASQPKCKAILILANKSDLWGPDADAGWTRLKYKLHLVDKGAVMQERLLEMVNSLRDVRRQFPNTVIFLEPYPSCAICHGIDANIQLALRHLLRKVVVDEFAWEELQPKTTY